MGYLDISNTFQIYFKYILDIYFKFNQNIFQIFAQKSQLERKCLGVTGQARAVLGQSNKEGSEEVEDVNIHRFTHVIINIITSSYIIEMRWSFEDIICMLT